MKYRTITILLLSCQCVSHAQQLVKKHSWKTSSMSDTKIEWVDLDNDSLLDVLVLAKGTNQKLQVQAYKNKLDSFPRTTIAELDFTLNSYSLCDINNDNKIDLAINGFKNTNQCVQLISQSNFQFTPSNITVPALQITQQVWVDFNLDGKLDWAVCGANFLKIFQGTGTGYVNKLDTTGINVSSIVTIDVSKDGRKDLIVSGNKQGKEFMALVQNSGGFKFEFIPIVSGIDGNLEIVDFNNDGFFDVTASSQNQIKFFTNNASRLKATDSVFGFQRGELKLADFDSDGLVELSYNGKTTSGQSTNFIRSKAGVITNLAAIQIRTQRWGDYDRDGDLDLLRVRDSSSYQIFEVFENKLVTTNTAPGKPGYTFWAGVFNKTIIYWSPSKGAKTDSATITYDLSVTLNGENLVTGLFDPMHETRLAPTHGNQFTNSFIILRGRGCPVYAIQAVDNAFNGSKLFEVKCAGNCSDNLTLEKVQACKGTNTTIGGDDEAHWFSFNTGFKGISKKLNFVADKVDTIVAVTFSGGCPKSKAYIISINESQKNESETKYVCLNKAIKLGIAHGWQTVKWTFGSETSAKDTVTITANKDLLVNVEASSDGGCKYKKEFSIKISDFDLQLDNNQYILTQGESVQLGANGGRQYEWLPNVALSNNKIANPVASPPQTTQYEVTASDSIGCTKKASVKVEVINTGFLPTMFTPNGDGKNDDYKILGLSGASEFEFTIYNREGNIVYETTNWQTATNTGWNGQKNGVNQPSGLYYWKVNGKQTNGQKLLLNGKNSGSVLLIRQ